MQKLTVTHAELDPMNRIGERLKEAQGLGIDINENKLSKVCGCSRQLMNTWVHNQTQPSKKYKKKMFHYFEKVLPEMEYINLFYTDIIISDPY